MGQEPEAVAKSHLTSLRISRHATLSRAVYLLAFCWMRWLAIKPYVLFTNQIDVRIVAGQGRVALLEE